MKLMPKIFCSVWVGSWFLSVWSAAFRFELLATGCLAMLLTVILLNGLLEEYAVIEKPKPAKKK